MHPDAHDPFRHDNPGEHPAGLLDPEFDPDHNELPLEFDELRRLFNHR